MSIPGWRKPTPPDPGGDRTGRLARVRKEESQRREPPDLESQKAQVLLRIWQGFSEPDPSTHRYPESGASVTRDRYADQARGLRLLVEEMQKDTEVSAALRTELVACLRSVAAADVRQPPSARHVDETRQQVFAVGPYHQTSHKLRAILAIRRLLAKQSDVSSRLREAEDILHDLRVSQLKAAVALSLTSPDRPSGNRAIVGDCVRVAESLGEIADILSSIRQRSDPDCEAKSSVETARELSGRLREATSESYRSTAKLRDDVWCFLEDRLASHWGESTGGPYSIIGGMLDLGPRLQHSMFDPGSENVFRSVGDLLTRSLLEFRKSIDERESLTFDSELAAST